jgi:hypothetical protein
VNTRLEHAPSSALERAAARAGRADPLAAWRSAVRGSGLVFNSPLWAEIVSRCYGFEDCTVRIGEASLPLFLTNSPLFGRKLVSAVFNSYASPRYATAAECGELIGRAREYAVARRGRLLEIKSVADLPSEVVRRFGLLRAVRHKLTVLPIGDYPTLWSQYSHNFRSHLRKARNRVARAGVRIYRSAAAAEVREFHDLLMRRYRNKHRMIGQPLKLFMLIQRHFLTEGGGDLWLARAPGGVLVGGLLLLTWGETVTACFGASHDGHQSLSIDAILKDHTLRFYSERGYRVYDLGISSPKQDSLLFAKARFPGVTFDLPYYYLPLRRGTPIPDVDFSDAFMALRRPFRYVPVAMAKLLSSVLVRYLN